MTKLTYRDADGDKIAAYHCKYDSLDRLIRSTEYGASNTITQRAKANATEAEILQLTCS